jgi:hypothetical protein
VLLSTRVQSFVSFAQVVIAPAVISNSTCSNKDHPMIHTDIRINAGENTNLGRDDEPRFVFSPALILMSVWIMG